MIGMYIPYIIDGLIALAVIGIAIYAITNARGPAWNLVLGYGILRALGSVFHYFHLSRMMSHGSSASGLVWATVSSVISYGGALLLLIALFLLSQPRDSR